MIMMTADRQKILSSTVRVLADDLRWLLMDCLLGLSSINYVIPTEYPKYLKACTCTHVSVITNDPRTPTYFDGDKFNCFYFMYIIFARTMN